MRPSLTTSAERVSSSRRAPPPEERGDGARRIGDVWQCSGTSGDRLGTNGVGRRALLYCYGIGIVVVGAVSAINVITTHHEKPEFGLAAPIVWEATSWVTFTFFLGIAWIAYRIAPLWGRPSWRLLVHIPPALAFSLAPVLSFLPFRH